MTIKNKSGIHQTFINCCFSQISTPEIHQNYCKAVSQIKKGAIKLGSHFKFLKVIDWNMVIEAAIYISSSVWPLQGYTLQNLDNFKEVDVLRNTSTDYVYQMLILKFITYISV